MRIRVTMRRWAVLMIAGLVPAGLQGNSGHHDLKSQYQFSCAQCHGADGMSRTPNGARLPGRILADSRWWAKQKDEALLKSLLEGKGAMPGFKGKLTPEEGRRMLTEVVRPMARRVR